MSERNFNDDEFLRTTETTTSKLEQYLDRPISQSSKNSVITSLREFYRCVIEPKSYEQADKDLNVLETIYFEAREAPTDGTVPSEKTLDMIGRDYIHFAKVLSEAKMARTSIGVRLNCVRGFLLSNRCEVGEYWRKEASRFLPKGTERKVKEQYISKENLQRLLMQMTLAPRTFCLFLKSSGMRPFEALAIQRKNVVKGNPTAVYLEVTKTHSPRWCFVDEEATEALGYYEKTLDSNEPLLFPYTTTQMSTDWSRALKLCKLDQTDKSTLRERYLYRLYGLRKFFRQEGRGDKALGTIGMDRDFLESLIGHNVGLDSVYANFLSSSEGAKKVSRFYSQASNNFWVLERYERLKDEAIKKGIFEPTTTTMTPIEAIKDYTEEKSKRAVM